MLQKVKDTNRLQNVISGIKKTFFSSPKRIIITASIITLLLISWMVFGPKKQQIQYQTAQVTRGTIISTVTESGNVASQSEAGVGSPTTGILTEIFVKDGENVAAGQNLFKVKSTATAQEITSAYAQYLSAQNTLNSANAQLYTLQNAEFVANQKFMNDAVANNKVTNDPVYIEEDAAWLAAEAAYKNQQSVIAQAQASQNAAWLSYQATQDSVVTAPVAGTVANIAVQVGDKVTASAGSLNTSSSTTNSPVLEIGDFSHPYVTVEASEVDAPHIHAGQKATITLSAFPNKTFVGNVSQVDTIGSITSGVVTYSVFVDFVAPPSSIQPGMSATVTIETARKDDVLTVPSSAVSSSTGQPTVRVIQNGQPTLVIVTTGISSDTDTEITSGLVSGETIVTSSILPTTSSSSSTSSPFSGLGGGRGGFGGGAVIRAGSGARGGQ